MQIEQSDVAMVAAAYGVSVDDSPPRPLGGAVNRVHRIGTSIGDLVVRMHPPETSVERLAAVHAIQDALRARGLPVPAILRTTEGTSWTTIRGRPTAVSVYVPNAHQMETWEDGQAAFAIMGRLHAALRSLPTSDLPPPEYGCYAAPITALAMLAETERAFRAQRGHDGYARTAAVRDATCALLHRLQIAYAGYESSLPRTLIHGDLLGSNLLLAGGRVVAILDFDRLAERERIYELAYALFHLLNRFRLKQVIRCGENGGLGDDVLANIGQLLRCYNAEVDLPLTAVEVAALPYEMARAPLYPVAAGESVADTLPIAGQLPAAQWLADNASYVGTSLMSLLNSDIAR